MPNITRKKIVAGNWKLYKTPDEATKFFSEFLPLIKDHNNIIFFPSAFALASVEVAVSGTEIGFGPQNIATEKEGAFTGELSAAHAKQMGATHVLIGHSERRKLFFETDDLIAKKMLLASELGLIPVLCVGESLEERKSNQTLSVISNQLKAGIKSLPKSSNFILAYEPVWAIGTGEVATPAQAEEAHTSLRVELKSLLGSISDGISILYGGSVKPENAAELIARPNVDGFLVGGASLKPKDFAAICTAVGSAAV
jgi:triosephosphate isomerase